MTARRWAVRIAMAMAVLGTASCTEGGSTGHESLQSLEGAIVNGDEVPPGKYPWMAQVGGCTAAVISPRFVLSAAHCFAGNRNEEGTLVGVEITSPPVFFGHPDLDSPLLTKHPVATAHMHPEYRKLTLEEVWGLEPYDVILLELEAPIILEDYLRLPTRAPVPDETIIAAGWGLSEDGPVRVLRETTLEVRNHTSCFNGDEKRFCSRGNDLSSNIWSGDSGGPVFVPDGDGFMVLGTNSTANGDADDPFASHARIVTFVPWIMEVAGAEFACTEADGTLTCVADTDECALGLDTCAPLASCVNTVAAYDCICPEGYAGDGQSCEDIDECVDGPGCGPRETCTNTDGSFECACAEGYQRADEECIDIDECADGAGCASGEMCTNTDGSFECAPNTPECEDCAEGNDATDAGNTDGDGDAVAPDRTTQGSASTGCGMAAGRGAPASTGLLGIWLVLAGVSVSRYRRDRQCPG